MKTISISLSPNTEKDDIWLAFKMIFQPWRWKKEKKKNESLLIKLEKEFKKYLGVKYTFSFNSGRSALLAILNALNLNKNDEILLQAFTCNAAVNPIIWSNLKPIYVDCDSKTFNIDIYDLKKKITSKARAVMVQHTFGLPAEIDEILKICQENNLILIEDCAHSLGTEYKGKKVGTFGKVSFFSFGRDKIISSVYGGIAVTNDKKLAKKIADFQKRISYPSYYWILQQLLHPVLMNWLILPIYQLSFFIGNKKFSFWIGKYLLVLFQYLHILPKAVHWKEKRGIKPDYFPKRLPNVLAILAFNQFKKLNKFNRHRQKIANFYFENLKNTAFELPLRENNIFLRFTIKYSKTYEIIKKAWQNNLLIGDWYTNPIIPDDTRLEKIQYQIGSCPQAEKLVQQTFNLPTHINISKKEARKIVDFLKNYEN